MTPDINPIHPCKTLGKGQFYSKTKVDSYQYEPQKWGWEGLISL